MHYYLTIAIAVAGNLTYHLSLKQAPAKLNPFFALATAYFVAFLLCLLGVALFPDGSRAFRDLRPSVFLIGLGVVGVEVGFLLAYRMGWNIGYASLLVNALAALVLLPLTVYYFKEGVSASKLGGVALCLAGLALLVRR